MRENADRVPDLEKRIAALEERLSRAPGEACPKCGELEFRTVKTAPHPKLGAAGAMTRTMQCGACQYTEDKMELPKR